MKYDEREERVQAFYSDAVHGAFCTEFVRSAFLFSFLPNFAVNESGQTVALVGLAVSLHYTADTLIKCVAGYLLDRFSLRWLLPATFVLMLSGLAAVFFSPYAWGLVAGSVMLGMGASPIWLICLEKVRLTERAAQMGAIYTVWLACIGLGPVTINLTFDYGFEPAFRLMVALLAVGCIASFGINRTTPCISRMSALPNKRQDCEEGSFS